MRLTTHANVYLLEQMQHTFGERRGFNESHAHLESCNIHYGMWSRFTITDVCRIQKTRWAHFVCQQVCDLGTAPGFGSNIAEKKWQDPTRDIITRYDETKQPQI